MNAPTNPPSAYHEKLPEYPKFEIVSDTIDGIIPSCHVKSWRHFEEILTQDQHNRVSGEMIYRGQRDHRWPLASTLGRWFDEGGIQKEIAESLLLQFRLAMRGRGTSLTNLSDEEVWAYGQHYELATPLLDWTKSPFVALYFAFLREDTGETGNTSRAIFCLNMTKICEVLDDIILEPQHNENARLVNQAGLFGPVTV